MTNCSADQRDVLARVALQHAFEAGNELIGAAVAEHGAWEVTSQLARSSNLSASLNPAHHTRWQSADWHAAARDEIASLYRHQMHVLTPGMLAWPQGLTDLDDRAPLALRVRGKLPLARQSAPSVAIVGARSATRYGVWVGEELGAQLAMAGCQIVSGGAFGIDAAAHWGCLSQQGSCVLVTAAGPDIAVPSAHDRLFVAVAESGSVVSEMPLGARPARHRFLVRNRIIAALADVVVVVEAAQRSGALATCRDAAALARQVAAVPGPVTSSMSQGCNSLIQNDGASLVTNAADVLEIVRRVAKVPLA